GNSFNKEDIKTCVSGLQLNSFLKPPSLSRHTFYEFL
ncbi:MAG: hypothetical protein ACJAZ2_002146, partial [Glaciecola sp.]